MSDIKNKIFEAIKDRQLISLATVGQDNRPRVRYVMGQGDETLTLRLVTFIGSRKATHIKGNPEVHVVCGVATPETAKHYVQIEAKAEISTDAELKKQLWHDELSHYFSGADDPNMCVVIVKPYRIEYQTMATMQPEVWEA